MKGLKDNRLHEKGKLEYWKIAQKSSNSSKPDHTRGTRPRLAQESLLQRSWVFSRQTRLGEKSLNPSHTRLNMRREK